MRFFPFLLLLWGLPVLLHAQSHWCGTTHAADQAWLDQYFSRSSEGVARSNNTRYLPIQFHLVGTSDGEGFESLSDVYDGLCTLNEDFEAVGLQFYLKLPIRYIANSTYYEHDGISGRVMMQTNNVSDAINMYIVKLAREEGIAGYWSPSGQAAVVTNGSLNRANRTISHEIGHALNLNHTFFGWEGQSVNTEAPAPATVGNNVPVERVDGSNCRNAADRFCDTAPDYLSDVWTCNGSGMSRVEQLDPDSVAFRSDGSNIMSYASDRCYSGFSVEQGAAMYAYAQDRYQNLINDQFVPIDFPEVVSLATPTDGSFTETFDEVRLEWAPTDRATSYLVQINVSSTFGVVLAEYETTNTNLTVTDLLANRPYFWRVRALNGDAPCSDYSEVRRFFTSIVSSTIDPDLAAAIRVFPNPSQDGQLFLRAQGLGATESLNWSLQDALGRTLNTGSIPSVGNDTHTIPVRNLPAGMYSLHVRMGERLLTRKVILN